MPTIQEEQENIKQLIEHLPTSLDALQQGAEACEKFGMRLKAKGDQASRKLLRILQKDTHVVMKALVRAYLTELSNQKRSPY